MIQVGDSQTPDYLIWPAAKNGMYLVKSGYIWVHEQSLWGRPSHPTSSRSNENVVWNGIWSLMVPPKIKNFIWKCAKGAIVTKAHLFKRRCDVFPLCPICHLQDETIEHLLLMCPCV